MTAPSENSAVAPALLPERRFLCGPVTSRRLARSCLVYLGLFSLGLALSQLSGHWGWSIFGLGLMIPGGGFLAHADLATWHGILHLGLAVLALLAFVAGLFLWFATGNVIAPPLIWLLSAMAAAIMDHGEPRHGAVLVAALAIGAAAIIAMLALLKRDRAAARRRAANAYLKQLDRRAPASHRSAGGVGSSPEFTPQDLKLMRFLLERALQPVKSYEGLEWLDQFQTAAIRYQLNFIGYALSMAQATRLPALGGYLNAAQRNLIDKQTDHRIWRYWALENLWGNLAADPDPIARENIMFTGFCAAQIAMYHAAAGRRDYDRPASFALRHSSGRNYDYDLAALIEALDRERRKSAFHLIACEPN